MSVQSVHNIDSINYHHGNGLPLTKNYYLKLSLTSAKFPIARRLLAVRELAPELTSVTWKCTLFTNWKVSITLIDVCKKKSSVLKG